MDIRELMRQMPERDASDLYLKVGLPPSIRVNSEVLRLEDDALTDAAMDELCNELMNEHQQRVFRERPDLDFAYTLESGKRYRINMFRQQGHIGIVARFIRDEDLSFQHLNLPDVVRELAELPRGLVILTGATGSGKSTTLAAMISHINTNFQRHIMTIEDPIEFIHNDKKSIINQREVGFDTQSFADALRHVVRQSPDVILIGEMRDMDTMMTAIAAAETGHLVLSTLHTSDVSHTLDRIVNYFPDHLKRQVQQELAQSLEGIICMRLLRNKTGDGRVPSLEILRTTTNARKALQDGELWRFKEIMQKGAEFGMQTFNQSMLKLFNRGHISYEEGLRHSSNPEEFKLNSKGMFTGTDSIDIYQSS
jgi:twitching motility protein PilT